MLEVSESVSLSPAEAEKILERADKVNVAACAAVHHQLRVSELAAIMRSGGWRSDTGAPVVVFDREGRVTSGIRTLLAISRANVSTKIRMSKFIR